jgi:4-hydroxy-3-polyprenylbenzoate decarboxylase
MDSSLLIEATLKDHFPPIALPKKEFMENAKAIWEELGLPPLKPESPWFGYSLGDWSERNEQMAQRAVKGDYFVTGEEIAKMRRKDVAMNTEIKHVMADEGRQALPAKSKSKVAAKGKKSSLKK